MNYQESTKRPREFLALTGMTVQEFGELLPYFQQAFETWMETHTMEGHPRLGRSYSNYKNSPLPTGEDKLFFILTFVKQAPTQTLHGRSFGMGQPKANQWIHLLHEVLNQALAAAGAKPTRRAEGLSQHLDEQAHEETSEASPPSEHALTQGVPPDPGAGAASESQAPQAESPRQAPDAVPTRVFFHDGTERPIQRPSAKATQRAYYSGKKNIIR